MPAHYTTPAYPWHSVTSPFVAQPLGSRAGESLNPFGSADAPARVPTFYVPPLSTTSLVSSPSPWSFNYQQSVFGCHVLQSSGVQLAEDFRRGLFNVTVNCDLCAESAPVRSPPEIVFDVSLLFTLARGTRRMFKLFVEGPPSSLTEIGSGFTLGL